MSERRSIFEISADLLAVRRPTRLVVDGFVLLVVATLTSLVYNAMDMARRVQPERPEAVWEWLFHPAELVSLISTFSYYAGWIMVAVGCARLIQFRQAPVPMADVPETPAPPR